MNSGQHKLGLEPGTKLTAEWAKPPADLESRAALCLLPPLVTAMFLCLIISTERKASSYIYDYGYLPKSTSDHIIQFYFWTIPASILFAISFYLFFCTKLRKKMLIKNDQPVKENINKGVALSRVLLTLAYTSGLFAFLCLLEYCYLSDRNGEVYHFFNRIFLISWSTYLILIVMLFPWGLSLLFLSYRYTRRKEYLDRGLCPRCHYNLRGSLLQNQSVCHCPECNLEIFQTVMP